MSSATFSGGVGRFAAQPHLGLAHLLVDQERGLGLDALGALLGGGDQAALLRLGLRLDAAAHARRSRVSSEASRASCLRQLGLGQRAQLGGRGQIGLQLLVPRRQGLVDGPAAEVHQDEQQHREVQQLQTPAS